MDDPRPPAPHLAFRPEPAVTRQPPADVIRLAPRPASDSAGSHAEKNAPAAAIPEGAALAPPTPSRNGAPVQSGRKLTPAYRAARGLGARILGVVLPYGAIADWAARLGISPQFVSKWTSEAHTESPGFADILLLPREVRLALWRSLLVRDEEPGERLALDTRLHRVVIEVSDAHRAALKGAKTPEQREAIARECDEAVAELSALAREMRDAPQHSAP